MSHLIILTAEMHKVAFLTLNIKYRHPGNVIGYIPVEFEVFRDGDCYKAVPLLTFQTRILTTLPNELVFKLIDGKVYCFSTGKGEVVEDIVNKLATMGIVEKRQKRVEGNFSHSCY